eukprot:TRINITY_DN9323_c0_g2_i1.p1 TRINITY_DN9323_c0_g2~~TRINITY_DN9323_c0_g2_i1.p1  ORF type:complete len:193 (-),score=15.51 TRINITY_DN9323_c0_g2_i1:133-711(-)
MCSRRSGPGAPDIVPPNRTFSVLVRMHLDTHGRAPIGYIGSRFWAWIRKVFAATAGRRANWMIPVVSIVLAFALATSFGLTQHPALTDWLPVRISSGTEPAPAAVPPSPPVLTPETIQTFAEVARAAATWFLQPTSYDTINCDSEEHCVVTSAVGNVFVQGRYTDVETEDSVGTAAWVDYLFEVLRQPDSDP